MVSRTEFEQDIPSILDAMYQPSIDGVNTWFAGKAMLAQSPEKPLPDLVLNRPKTGFSWPMAAWLADATRMRAGSDLPLLAAPGTPWARRWARAVIERMSCESNTSSVRDA